MKTLTLWQPWASLIAVGAKRWETRDWPSPAMLIGHRIAIHAAARRIGDLDRELEAACGEVFDSPHWGLELPRGAVVCTARLTGCYQVAEYAGWARVFRLGRMVPGSDPVVPGQTADLFGNYEAGRWLWRLADIERIEPPAPARGERKLWEWPFRPEGEPL